jgi:hypothetical protein
MKSLLLLIFILALSNASKAGNGHYGRRCTGSYPCSACTNCSGCAHCNAGGSCGVCAGGSGYRHSGHSKKRHHNSGRSAGTDKDGATPDDAQTDHIYAPTQPPTSSENERTYHNTYTEGRETASPKRGMGFWSWLIIILIFLYVIGNYQKK